MSKAKSLRAHFEKRCLERVGRILNEKALVRAIQESKLKFLLKLSNRVSAYEFLDEERKFKILYDRNRHRCITILDESMDVVEWNLNAKKKTREERILLVMRLYGFNWEEAHDFLESL